MRKLIIFILLMSVSSFAYADIIHLKSGGKIEGKIIEKPEIPPKKIPPIYKIKTSLGIITIKENEISSIKYEEIEFKEDINQPKAMSLLAYLTKINKIQQKVIEIQRAFLSARSYEAKTLLYIKLSRILVQVKGISPPPRAKKLHYHHIRQLTYLSHSMFYSKQDDYKTANAYLEKVEEENLIVQELLKNLINDLKME